LMGYGTCALAGASCPSADRNTDVAHTTAPAITATVARVTIPPALAVLSLNRAQAVTAINSAISATDPRMARTMCEYSQRVRSLNQISASVAAERCRSESPVPKNFAPVGDNVVSRSQNLLTGCVTIQKTICMATRHANAAIVQATGAVSRERHQISTSTSAMPMISLTPPNVNPG